MNYRTRVVDGVQSWYSALFEQRAEARSKDEWHSLSMKAVLAAVAFTLLAIPVYALSGQMVLFDAAIFGVHALLLVAIACGAKMAVAHHRLNLN